MQCYVNHMDYAPWVANIKAIKVNIANTDTDSLCFWTRSDKSLNNDGNNDAYNANTNAFVPSETEFSTFKEFLLQKYTSDKLDTANYQKNNPYYTDKYKKDLHRFQRDVVEPHYIRRLIAVNPTEYFIEKSNDDTVKKHKGVKRNTKLTVTTYLENIVSIDDIYNCLDNEFWTPQTFRQECLQMKAGVVTNFKSRSVHVHLKILLCTNN